MNVNSSALRCRRKAKLITTEVGECEVDVVVIHDRLERQQQLLQLLLDDCSCFRFRVPQRAAAKCKPATRPITKTRAIERTRLSLDSH